MVKKGWKLETGRGRAARKPKQAGGGGEAGGEAGKEGEAAVNEADDNDHDAEEDHDEDMEDVEEEHEVEDEEAESSELDTEDALLRKKAKGKEKAVEGSLSDVDLDE